MKTRIKRGIGIIVSMALIFGIIPTFKDMEVRADNSSDAQESMKVTKNVIMGTEIFDNYDPWDADTGGKLLYLGTYSNDRNRWRVLSCENGRLLLHLETRWAENAQYSTTNLNIWEDSYVRTLLDDNYNQYFTDLEKAAILETTLPARSSYTATGANGTVLSECEDKEMTEKLFLMSAAEIEQFYGEHTTGETEWLRTVRSGNSSQVAVHQGNGTMRFRNANYNVGMRIKPACYLDISDVLFIRQYNVYNNTYVASTATIDWSKETQKYLRLTLKATDEDLNASLAGNKNYFTTGENITINHTPASQVYSGANQTSVLVVNADNNDVVAYGKLGNTTESSSTFDISNSWNVEEGDYLLYVFAERNTSQAAGNISTYASALGDPIPIKVHAHTWSSVWEQNEDYHWHDCTKVDCPLTENSEKGGYGVHNWNSGVVTQAATCTEAGIKTYTCQTCKYERTEVIPAKGHSMGNWQTTAEADCTNAGSEQRKCSVCGYTEMRGINPLGHAWDSNPTVDKAATCTEAGSQSVHCTRCGEVKDVTVIPTKGHSFGAWQTVLSPNCTNQGSEKRVCSACGFTETRNLDPLGHDWDVLTVDKAATCTEDGSQSRHCTRAGCDAVYESQVIPALGHDYGAWQQVTAPTCTTKGSEKHVCNRCNKEEFQDIAALGHDWESNPTVDKAATCTEAGSRSVHCTRCDTVKNSEILPALGHDWGNWQEVTAPDCVTPGSEKHECQRAGCTEEESRDIAALGHDWGNWQEVTAPDCENPGSEKHECQRAGCTEEESREIAALGHDWGNWQEITPPDCENPGSEKHECQRAGCTEEETREIPALGHTFGEWETILEPTCADAGSEKHICEVCGFEELREIPPAHDWEDDYTIDKEPTCTKPGEESIHCKNCDETKEEREIPALGHKWDEGKITREPTYTREGERTYTCTVCGEKRTEPIPKLVLEANPDTDGTNTGEPGQAAQTAALPGRVKTGDDSDYILWVHLLAISAAVMAGAGEQRLKKKKKRR